MTLRLVALIASLLLFIGGSAVRAQPRDGTPRIGVLSLAPATAVAGSPYDAFREALRELGYAEGKNITIEFRFADGKYNRLPELAADVVRAHVDVIVTDGGGTVARAALNATKTIPIVMGTIGDDPVASGLVASLARPGGNVTGFTFSYVEIAGKRLQILKEMIPTVTRVAVLSDETGPSQFRVAETAARSLGVQLVSLTVRGPADFDAAFATASSERAGALLQLASRKLYDNRRAIIDRALRHRLPGMFELGFAEAGALASYGSNVEDNFRRAAVYVDKILKGARPGDLPVQQPTRFDLVINLRTARALGLTVPPSMLLQATRTIE
jgi:putative tryptophan/tyrosine transport system substrate-binding protein